LQHSFYNYSALEKRRIDLVVGVSYADDLELKMLYQAQLKIWKVIDKDLMVLTILNLTLVPSILIFDFGLSREPSYFKMRSKASKRLKKHLMNKILLLFLPLEHWTLELKAG
jgi:small conductance mechanosensitive channel